MAQIIVYLPVAVSIDTETGEMTDAPQVDFAEAPWMYVDSEENIWQDDREDVGEYSWGRDKVREDMAVVAIEWLARKWEAFNAETG